MSVFDSARRVRGALLFALACTIFATFAACGANEHCLRHSDCAAGLACVSGSCEVGPVTSEGSDAAAVEGSTAEGGTGDGTATTTDSSTTTDAGHDAASSTADAADASDATSD